MDAVAPRFCRPPNLPPPKQPALMVGEPLVSSAAWPRDRLASSLSETVPSGGRVSPDLPSGLPRETMTMEMRTRYFEDRLTRYAVAVRFRYRRSTDTTFRPRGGRTRDLSTRGAWVELPECMAAPDRVVIALDATDGALQITAHVAWACPERHEFGYLHGLLFAAVTPAQRERLRALLVGENPPVAVRLYCALAATCRHKDARCAPIPCAIRDLSASGMGVRLPERIAPGTELHIGAPTLFGRIAADVGVVWADAPDRHPPGAPCRHGLRFLHVDASSQLPLRALLGGLR